MGRCARQPDPAGETGCQFDGGGVMTSSTSTVVAGFLRVVSPCCGKPVTPQFFTVNHVVVEVTCRSCCKTIMRL